MDSYVYRRCRRRFAGWGLTLALPLLAACQTDSYDKGEGSWSLTRADFVVAHADDSKRIDWAVTDDGDTLRLTDRPAAQWIVTADSLYRAVLYYDRQDGDSRQVAPRGLSPVTTLRPLPLKAFVGGVTADPVTFESIWTGRNGSYINVGLYLKMGQTSDEKAHHVVGIALQKTVTRPDGGRTAYLRLYHNQGGVPEYYSSKFYVSIPCEAIQADSVYFSVNTYDGERTYGVKK